MSNRKQEEQIPGITREDETRMLAEILSIAEASLNRTRGSVKDLTDELHELKEVYDEEDREGLAQWFNTDARFQQVRQDLLRAERCRKKPYFGRIDFVDTGIQKQECYYIGKSVIAEDPSKPKVIDWRAPIASVYYEKSLGKCTYSVKGEGAFEIDLSRKRTYEIDNDRLIDFYDSDVVANDDLLTKYLAKNKRAVLGEIIATIQQEQNEIIRKKPQHNVVVQGGAGSGKTTVAMHRISYILYNYDLEFQPKDFYIIGSNRILLNYITGVLPDLDVYGIAQMTMEQLFIRLLYEDWDPKKYTVKALNKGDTESGIKGSYGWFQDLEDFCRRYEWNYIPREDIRIEKTNRLIMSRAAIEKVIKKFHYLSLQDKKDKLTEYLMAQLENEIYGRYYSYPPSEQKALTRYYQTYFGRREWKGSIFELYEDFLREQNEKGCNVTVPDTEFDLYDLAALAYLYKRIKETEVIQEASHVVIDEAQDFGMTVYGALKYCLSKCTYTIMGDVSQNIYFNYGLQDWEELRRLMLPGEFDCFEILTKSYRNTVEISNFAMNILQHGSFPVYPVEPIIRHGNEVRTTGLADEDALIDEAAKTVKGWQKTGYETIAIICRNDEEAARVSGKLGKKVPLKMFDFETEEFGNGVMVLPIEYSKGLEFDAVLLFNADDKNYPAEDGFIKLLYVATTRALHELVVLYAGNLTSLIAEPVSEEKKQKVLVDKPKATLRKYQPPEPKTKREIELERAMEGHREMELRNQFGPRRIETVKPVKNPSDTTNLESAATSQPNADNSTYTGGRLAQYTSVTSAYSGGIRVVKKPVTAQRTEQKERGEANPCEFGEMPNSTSLRPLGHANINTSVLWATQNKDCVDISSGYGTLRITPIANDTVRITFSRTPIERLEPVPQALSVGNTPQWKFRELRDKVEVQTQKLTVRVDKKSGAISFHTAGEQTLLSENIKLPRQVEKGNKNQTWTYFDWGKKEVLKAQAPDGEWLSLDGTARYISHGESTGEPACILSNRGYQILVPPGRRVMCCTIPTYGTYLYTEGKAEIDYFFRTAL